MPRMRRTDPGRKDRRAFLAVVAAFLAGPLDVREPRVFCCGRPHVVCAGLCGTVPTSRCLPGQDLQEQGGDGWSREAPPRPIRACRWLPRCGRMPSAMARKRHTPARPAAQAPIPEPPEPGQFEIAETPGAGAATRKRVAKAASADRIASMATRAVVYGVGPATARVALRMTVTRPDAERLVARAFRKGRNLEELVSGSARRQTAP